MKSVFDLLLLASYSICALILLFSLLLAYLERDEVYRKNILSVSQFSVIGLCGCLSLSGVIKMISMIS